MAEQLEEHIVRIIAALRRRVERVFSAPIIEERDFLDVTANHGKFCGTLRSLGQISAAEFVEKNARHVGLCWLKLGMEHLEDARVAVVSARHRTVYSRSYYAAYNASKAVRYLVNGVVSLKGDDHYAASDLPDDFPDGDRWSATITILYEHRLRADYDNWLSTSTNMSLSPHQALASADSFVAAARRYLGRRLGVQL
jgi:hypothetical protein